MKKIFLLLMVAMAMIFTQCKLDNKGGNKKQFIKPDVVENVIKALVSKYDTINKSRIERGVKQVASLWTKADGDAKQFEEFCLTSYVNADDRREALFQRLSTNFEVLAGNFNKMALDLKRPLHLDIGEIMPIDELFGAYDPTAHLQEDFYQNKIAFITMLNFPFYSLKEKNELGSTWTRQQWAYVRLGDAYTSRVPADLIQKVSDALTGSDTYISEYNIYMGNLLTNDNKTLFPKELKLISHWGLRDELKANYTATGLDKQKMIYEVMKHIILQDIPDSVINNDKYQWNPYQNKLYKEGKEISFKPEPDTRYQYLLNNFIAVKATDPYNPAMPTYIQRSFEEGMEIPQEEVEKIFIELVSSPQVKQVAQLISKRLGRNLEPFDIWYDGFKDRNAISEDVLTEKVKAKYANKDVFAKDLPNLLQKLDFDSEKAKFIASKIDVDASRGAGHAWGSAMKSDNAHLRTRVPAGGMNYKGYNIAIHEFGHTVEQTLSLQDVDYYMLNGVPNTASTEALAFIFQRRDLELLGMKNVDPNKKYLMTLDNFWACYEIMGVSLVDMQVWKWLYAHPNANAAELKEAVINAAIEVWNKYYADAFGVKDQPILAIYSHMIDAPLYLSSYPVGHLVDFQIEKQIEGKSFAKEIQRIYTYGSVTPDAWMKHAVGTGISNKPLLDATSEALKHL